MRISAVNTNQQSQKQNFKGKFIIDELNLTSNQLREVKTSAKNFDISQKPYDISFFSDPRDRLLVMTAENTKANTICSVTVKASQQHPARMEQKTAELIDMYESKYIKPNTFWGKVKRWVDIVNPFSI